jgi:6-phosphogluconolactonase (cycloisomerase 2 family)
MPQPSGFGIGICRFDHQTGELTPIKIVHDHITAGNALFDARRNVIYFGHEDMTLPDRPYGGGGQLFAFMIDRATGDLIEINRQPSYGALPVCIAQDSTGYFLIVPHHAGSFPITKVKRDDEGRYSTISEFDDASVVLFPLEENGEICHPCDIFIQTGSGGPLKQQTHPHLHSISMSPSGKLFVVGDKGNDQILMFRIDYAARKLVLCGDRPFATIPGASIRCSVFHPTRNFLFANYETKSVVASFRYDEEGVLEPLCVASSLPEGVEDSLTMMPSEIKVHSSGKYLYTLIRGINAASVFEIDEASGALTLIQTLKLDGKNPRSCTISPDGRFLLVAMILSSEVLVLAIGHDGKLSSTGYKAAQPHPANITFLPA